MELETRFRESAESMDFGKNRLLICPPTDAGISILTSANKSGETGLLCFSDNLANIAKDCINRRMTNNLKLYVGNYFSVPVENKYFDIVYANCFFDFCNEKDFDRIWEEIRRITKKGGLVFSVYMGEPVMPIGKIWSWIFNKVQVVSKGCHPVSILEPAMKNGFRIKIDQAMSKYGFPLRYVVAQAE